MTSLVAQGRAAVAASVASSEQQAQRVAGLPASAVPEQAPPYISSGGLSVPVVLTPHHTAFSLRFCRRHLASPTGRPQANAYLRLKKLSQLSGEHEKKQKDLFHLVSQAVGLYLVRQI